MTLKAYKNHRAGSRKGQVHLTFNTKGADAAFAQGKRMKLKESTLTQWVRTWKAERRNKAPAKVATRKGAENHAGA